MNSTVQAHSRCAPRPDCCKQPDCERPCTCAMGKLSRFIEPVILRILHEKKKSYGYEIAEYMPHYALTDATIEGAALYRTLRTLEANGHVRSSWEAGDGPARRSYSLTRSGEAHLHEWAEMLDGLGQAMIDFATRIRTLEQNAEQTHQDRQIS